MTKILEYPKTFIILAILWSALVGVAGAWLSKPPAPTPPPQSEAIRLLSNELETCLGYSAGFEAGYGTFCKQVGCALGPDPVGEGG